MKMQKIKLFNNQKWNLIIGISYIFSLFFVIFNYFVILSPNLFTGMLNFVCQFLLTGFGIILIVSKSWDHKSIIAIFLTSFCFWMIFGYFHLIFHLGNLRLSVFITEISLFSIIIIISTIKDFNQIGEEFATYTKNLFHRVNLNYLLFGILVLLLCFWWTIKIPYLPTEDNWYHVALSNNIKMGVFPADSDNYWNKLTYHYLGAIYSILTGISMMAIGKYVIFIQLPLAVAIFIRLLNKFFNNPSKSIIIALLFIVTIFGTILNFSQYWPTAIGSIFVLNIFSDIFTEFDLIINWKEEIAKINWKFFFAQFFQIFALITSHISNCSLYLGFLIFISLIFVLTDKKFVPYFGFYILCFGLNIIFNFEFLKIIFSALLPNIKIVLIFLGIIIILSPLWVRLLKFLANMILNSSNSSQTGQEAQNTAVKIENNGKFYKIILPVVGVGSFVLFLIFFSNKSSNWFQSFILLLQIESIAMLISIAILAFLIHRNNNTIGKIIYLNFIFFTVFLISTLILGFASSFAVRIIIFFNPFIFLGVYMFWSYIKQPFYQYKTGVKILAISFILLAFTSGFLYNFNYNQSISPTEKNFIQNVSDLSYQPVDLNQQADKNQSILIIGAFRWKHPFYYFSQNFEIYYRTQYTDNLHPENHFDSNGNFVFSEIENDTDIRNIFLFLEETYLSDGILNLDGSNSGILSLEEWNAYYNLQYFNRVSVGNHGKSLYWAILDSKI